MLGLLNINKFLAAPLVAALIMTSMFSGVQASSTMAPLSASSCETERG